MLSDRLTQLQGVPSQCDVSHKLTAEHQLHVTHSPGHTEATQQRALKPQLRTTRQPTADRQGLPASTEPTVPERLRSIRAKDALASKPFLEAYARERAASPSADAVSERQLRVARSLAHNESPRLASGAVSRLASGAVSRATLAHVQRTLDTCRSDALLTQAVELIASPHHAAVDPWIAVEHSLSWTGPLRPAQHNARNVRLPSQAAQRHPYGSRVLPTGTGNSTPGPMAPRGQWRPGDDFCARLGRLFADAGDATHPDTGLPTRAGWGDSINPGEADMASVPYAFVDDANHFRFHANAKIAADSQEVAASPDIVVARAPLTSPSAAIPWAVWACVRDTVRATERLCEVHQLVRAFSVHLRWPTVAEYYCTDSDHANWIRFHESYRREFEAKVRNPHSRFRQKAVPGSSQTGWFCHERRIPPEFLGAPTGWVAGTSWIGDVLTFSTEKLDAAGEGLLTPVLFSPAQQHTQVDCGRLRHLLHYLDSIGYRYRDLEFADEASIDGARARSRFPGHTRLACNHASFFEPEAFKFCLSKSADKHTFFVNPPRLSPPRMWMPVVPAECNPAGCISKTILTTSGGTSSTDTTDVVGQARQRIAKRKLGALDTAPYTEVASRLKRRMTHNCSFPGRFSVSRAKGFVRPQPTLARPWSHERDASPNAFVDQSCSFSFPTMKYMSMESLAQQTAILQTSGVPLLQYKGDLVSFYEFLPKNFHDVRLQVQWTLSEGPQSNHQFLFGAAAEPMLASRWQLMNVFIWESILRFLQDDFLAWQASTNLGGLWQPLLTALGDFAVDGTGLLQALHALATTVTSAAPAFNPHHPDFAAATIFTARRRQQAASGLWFSSSIFIDDSPAICLAPWFRIVRGVMQLVWSDLNFDVADGTPYKGTDRCREDKNEEVVDPSSNQMEILGQQIITAPIPKRHFGALKRNKYHASGQEILTSMTGPRFCVKSPLLDKWIGQLGYSATFGPLVAAYTQTLRSLLPPSWQHMHMVPLSRAAQLRIEFIMELLLQEDGVALFPRRAPVDNVVRDVWWIFCDAARTTSTDPSIFSGFSSWAWRHGSSEVFFYSGRWRLKEMAQLDITSLEFHNMSMASALDWESGGRSFEDIIRASDAQRQRGPSEVTICCDNQGASAGTANTGRAHVAALRLLNQRRTAHLLASGRRTIAFHIKRWYNRGADEGSKGHIAALQQEVQDSLFGYPGLSFHELPAPGKSVRSLDKELLASKGCADPPQNKRLRRR
jgi:hypothetical protein